MTRLQGDGAIYFCMASTACLPFGVEHPFAWVFLCLEILAVWVNSSMHWCSRSGVVFCRKREVCLGVSWNTWPPPCPVLHQLWQWALCFGTRHGLRDILLWRRWCWKRHSYDGSAHLTLLTIWAKQSHVGVSLQHPAVPTGSAVVPRDLVPPVPTGKLSVSVLLRRLHGSAALTPQKSGWSESRLLTAW